MENTLLVGDRVLVNKLAYRFGEIERGDVIVFDGADSFESEITIPEPAGRSTARCARSAALRVRAGTETDYIKRVIGVGGDRVVLRTRPDHGQRHVLLEDYLYPGDVPSANEFDITVPEGRVWVMGDHRSASADSRAHLGDPGGGTVPVDRVSAGRSSRCGRSTGTPS